jgi:hypothetical protein
MTRTNDACVHCGADSGAVPVIRFEYRGRSYGICSQHLPVLIHDPARLVGQLPGAEGLAPAEHKD